MDQKVYVIDQKGLNMYEKGQKKRSVWTLNTCFLVEFFLPESGVPPTTH